MVADVASLSTLVFGSAADPNSTVEIGGVSINLLQKTASNPSTAGFVNDGIHPNTVIQGVLGNVIMQGTIRATTPASRCSARLRSWHTKDWRTVGQIRWPPRLVHTQTTSSIMCPSHRPLCWVLSASAWQPLGRGANADDIRRNRKPALMTNLTMLSWFFRAVAPPFVLVGMAFGLSTTLARRLSAWR